MCLLEHLLALPLLPLEFELALSQLLFTLGLALYPPLNCLTQPSRYLSSAAVTISTAISANKRSSDASALSCSCQPARSSSR